MTFTLNRTLHFTAWISNTDVPSGPPSCSARWLRGPDLVNQLRGRRVEIELSLPDFEFLISEHLIGLAFQAVRRRVEDQTLGERMNCLPPDQSMLGYNDLGGERRRETMVRGFLARRQFGTWFKAMFVWTTFPTNQWRHVVRGLL